MTGTLQTWSGAVFDFRNPHPNSVMPEDVAHHLARICRFKGALAKENYSVAEHSCLMHDYVMGYYGVAEKLAYHCLVHDAEEAYTGDFPSGLKQILSEDTKAQLMRIHDVVMTAFGAHPILPMVKALDIRICVTEAREFMNFSDPVWDYIRDVDPLPVTLQYWQPHVAEGQWWKRYQECRHHIKMEANK